MMDTREVAAYLRLKERRIYDLVRQRAIPHVRATGKLLFPRAQVDAWLAAKGEAPVARPRRARRSSLAATIRCSNGRCANRVAASRSSPAAAARASTRSRAAKRRAAAVHWLDEASGDYNVPLIRETLAGADVVALEWARRTQGLLLAAGNPQANPQNRRSCAEAAANREAAAGRRQPSAVPSSADARPACDPGSLDWLPPSGPRRNRARGDRSRRTRRRRPGHRGSRAREWARIRSAGHRNAWILSRFAATRSSRRCRRCSHGRATPSSSRRHALGGYDVANTGRVVFNA